MSDPSKADWFLAYVEAFRKANPNHQQPVLIRHWTGGWYQLVTHGGSFNDGSKKKTRRQIEEMTARLVAAVEQRDTVQ